MVENILKAQSENVAEFNNSSVSYISSEKIYPPMSEMKELYEKKVYDPTYGNIDFRATKIDRFSDTMANKIVDYINASPELKADCQNEISDTVNLIIKNIPLLVPNKAYNIDPAKWFLMRCKGNEYVIFGKTVALDIDENYFFDKLGLKDKSLRDQKLDIVTSYHAAVKSGNNSSIKYTLQNLTSEWYAYLYKKYIDLITTVSHLIYWIPAAFELLPVHYPWFGTIPVSDWFLFPHYFLIQHNFSRTTSDKVFKIGPPINILQNPLYPGKMLCDIGLFFKATVSFFGGKITLTRDQKTY
jgi:hypothetical protein